MKVPLPLESLVRDGLIDEVIRPLMAGKEASVYVVVSHGVVCCAKAYKDAAHRSFRQRATYQEGRSVRNSRQARAMQKGSRYGKKELEEDWQNAEVDALFRLAAAGVRVPRPLNFSAGVLLMELVVDEDGDAAPRLNDVTLTPETARRYHQTLLRDVVKMLCVGLVHGDLSEYNVLVDAVGPVIIDLPQAIDAAANNNAPEMLKRDVGNLAAYFGRFVPELATTDYGREIWQLYERGKLTPDTELTGRFQQPAREANVGSVLQDIDDARRDAARRRPALPLERRKSVGDEAWRGRVPDALPAEEGEPPAVRLVVSPSGGRKIVEVTPSRAPVHPAPPPPPKAGRRRRRGGAGTHAPQQGATPARSAGPPRAAGPPHTGGPPHTSGPPRSAGPPRSGGPPHTSGPPRSAGPSHTSGPPRSAGPSRSGGPPHTAGPPRSAGPPPPELLNAPPKTLAAPPQKPRRRRSRHRNRGPAAD